MTELAARVPQASGRTAAIARAGKLADRGCTMVCGLAIALLVALAAGTVAGYRPLIDHSDSMRPAIRAGDLLITHSEPASAIRVGNTVTFIDRALGSRLITHRVVALRASGNRIDFVTRGDANTASESWSAPRHASLGKLLFRVPAVGRDMAWMTSPWPRSILLGLATLVLSAALLRRIWKA
jgi:signal peptidase I